jgi:hypothetical protein
MLTGKNVGALLFVSVCAWRLVACSASTQPGSANGSLTGAGGAYVPLYPGSGASSGASGASGTRGFAGSQGAGDNPGIFKIPDSGATVRSKDSSCGAVTEVPEQIIKYTEASVTDTTYTSTPVAVFVMLDRSSSMTMPAPGATMTS